MSPAGPKPRRPRRVLLAQLALVVAAALFGATFVIVKDAVAEMPPQAFLGWRFLLGTLALLACGLIPRLPGGGLPRGRQLWRDGLVAGVLLYAGYAFQTVGLTHTTASRSALITGLYVVLTPFLAAALARRRVSASIIAGSVLAFVGMALLAAPAGPDPDGSLGTGLNFGDLLTLGCALAFAGHVVVLARCSQSHPTVPYTAVQLGVVSLLALLISIPTEGLPLPQAAILPALLLTGLGASAGAFILQVWAQSVVGPARTVLVLSLEIVFGALLGVWLRDERLGPLGWVGALAILLGIQVVIFFTSDEDDLPGAEARTAAH